MLRRESSHSLPSSSQEVVSPVILSHSCHEFEFPYAIASRHNLILSLHHSSEVIPESGCRIWTGSTRADGYGQLTVNGHKVRAHRLAWMLKHGPIPHGYLICHHCDVRPCINEEHLFLGTHQDNAADAMRKGRLKGKIVMAETREKLSLAGRRRAPATAEARANMRKAQLGRKHSQETIAKIVLVHRGRKRSLETCKKIQAAALLKMRDGRGCYIANHP